MTDRPTRERFWLPRRQLQRDVALLLAAVGLVLPWLLPLEDLADPGRRMLGIFIAAIVLWVSEAIPLHATALLVIALEVVLLSDQAVVAVADDAPGYATFLATLADPIVILFLGGFMIADTAAKLRVDRALARVLLRPFGDRPSRVVLGLMLVTALLSAFASNTATTATMIAIVGPLLATLPADDQLRPAVALSIPIAANIGGMATPIGTPPNAIALASLADAGIRLTFFDWVLIALPLTAVVLVGAWVLLLRLFPPASAHLDVHLTGRFERSRNARIFYAVALATVGMWLTEPLHGVSSNVVALIPIVVLPATKVVDVDDIHGLSWDVLWLVSGGIALGLGVGRTGLDEWIVGLVSWESIPNVLLLVALAAMGLVFSTVMSNTAVANLLIPIGLTIAQSAAVQEDPLLVGALIAIACSLAMALPISTPPNAIVYATGAVTTRQMATIGAPIGVLGLALFLLVGPPLWRLLGLLS